MTPNRILSHSCCLLLLTALLVGSPALAAKKKGRKAKAAPQPTFEAQYEESLFQGLTWRNIGPYRGGRVTTVTGVPQQPHTFYHGATGGGVWKTEDAGNSWTNLSDGHFRTGSVGAIAVAPSDPNVIYVGMGESPICGVATSFGDDAYRSTDGGRSWSHLGLVETRQISAVRVHPDNPDVVWVAAQGNMWKPTKERGIYLSTDGGANWEQTLFVSEDAGASDLSLDATNPRILTTVACRGRFVAAARATASGGRPTAAVSGNGWRRVCRARWARCASPSPRPTPAASGPWSRRRKALRLGEAAEQ